VQSQSLFYFFYKHTLLNLKIFISLIVVFFCFSCHTSKVTNEYSRYELKKRTFLYFWEQAHPSNFQIPDRYPSLTFSSIAATGFGLTAYIVGIENHFIGRSEGADRTLKTLEILWHLPQGIKHNEVSGYRGFYYHFLTLDKALRYKDVELSSIDTGLLMAGILSAMSYYDGNDVIEKKIRDLSDKLYRRVEWDWMLQHDGLLSMGWHPEKGFIHAKWSGYNEAMILLIMSVGSPTHAIPEQSWEKWCSTYECTNFMGQKNVQFDPLFGHQYSHIWIDFRGIQDHYMKSEGSDYFINSTHATLSNRSYCIANPKNYIGYGENCWGLTACDGPYNGEKTIEGHNYIFYDYRARGAASMQIIDDGTIAPTAAGGSMPFLPKEAESALKHMWESYYKDLIGVYGFKDAFNLTYKDDANPNGWYDMDYLGIDQGPILLQMQNYETELIWKIMKKNPYIMNGLKKAGFEGGWLEGKS
jgi:hypothetical protein